LTGIRVCKKKTLTEKRVRMLENGVLQSSLYGKIVWICFLTFLCALLGKFAATLDCTKKTLLSASHAVAQKMSDLLW